MIDAPVSGGTVGAAAGMLTFIVDGDAAALEPVRPVLATMGKNIFHASGNGAGTMLKALGLAAEAALSARWISLSVQEVAGAGYGVCGEAFPPAGGSNFLCAGLFTLLPPAGSVRRLARTAR
jgi:6-phosphogluconate dehydrogenase (decarboxylating)